MDIYLENVLKGFISLESHVELNDTMRSSPEFILVDVDKDDMPEIIFSFKEGSRYYIGILKRREGIWSLDEVREDSEDEEQAIKNLIVSIENDRLTIENIGEAFDLDTIFNKSESRFVSIIDNKTYYASIEAGTRQNSTVTPEVIQFTQGDVLGKGTPDSISLLGNRPTGTAGGLVQDMVIRVQSGLTGVITDIPLKTRNGYYPRIVVENFTGSRGSDILVTIYTGRVGEYVHAYIYTFENDQPVLIFDSNVFNETSTGLVEYLDDYRVRITTQNPPRQYMLDVSEKKDDYLGTVYNEDGSLIQDTFGEILGLVNINPVDYDKNGIYSIEAIQRIIGTNVLDTLGLLENLLVWDRAAENFGSLVQYVSLYGVPIGPQENMNAGISQQVFNQGLTNFANIGQGNMNQGNANQGNMNQGNMNQGNMNQGNMNQGNMGQGNMGQGNTTQGNMNQGSMNQGNMNQGNMGQGNMGQGNMGQGNMGQGNMGQGNMGQGNMGQGNMTQGNMTQGNMGQGNMNQGNMGQGSMNQGNMNQGNTAQGDMNQSSVNQGNTNQGNTNQGTQNQGWMAKQPIRKNRIDQIK